VDPESGTLPFFIWLSMLRRFSKTIVKPRNMNARLLALGGLLVVLSSAHAGDLIQITNQFDTDPHWEGVNNRVQAQNPPTKKQAFGWQRPSGSTTGTIGGVIWRSRTPAWYAMKIGPFSFNDTLSASGSIMLAPQRQRSSAYFGFFNHERQEWRPWSSIAARVGDARQESNGSVTADFTIDYMSAGWKAGGYTVARVPADGQFHQWSFTYEPDVTVDSDWPQPSLKEWLGDKRVGEEALLAIARSRNPSLTLSQLRELLYEAEYRGLIEFHLRRGVGWQIRSKPQEVKGRIVCRLNNGPRQTHFLNRSVRDERLILDRFGIFNFQLPGDDIELYLADLAVNGEKVDLSKDPQWDGHSNQLQFIERDFHAKQDFGYSDTDHAGASRGEIGGTFWRTEPVDPLHASYAADVGTLTLEDRLEFSGRIAFMAGGTDAGMGFGYFNKQDQMAEFKVEQGAKLARRCPTQCLWPSKVPHESVTTFLLSFVQPIARVIHTAMARSLCRTHNITRSRASMIQKRIMASAGSR
jgi:hypothetical protein